MHDKNNHNLIPRRGNQRNMCNCGQVLSQSCMPSSTHLSILIVNFSILVVNVSILIVNVSILIVNASKIILNVSKIIVNVSKLIVNANAIQLRAAGWCEATVKADAMRSCNALIQCSSNNREG
jgi:hypothetical protein